jgi:hypothetical protein
MTKRLDGAVALVTGASSGIGEAAGLGALQSARAQPHPGETSVIGRYLRTVVSLGRRTCP